MPAAIAGCSALAGYLGNGFNEIVKQEFFNFIAGKSAARTTNTYRYGQFAPEGVARLMPELKPTFK
jgi:hypothetical protein